MARQNARNTYAKRNKATTPTSFAGVWLLLGIFLGVGIMGLAYIFYNPANSLHFKMGQSSMASSAHPSTTTSSSSAEQKTSREKTRAQARKVNNGREKESDQRFEFYTMLPGMEVELPERQTTTQATTQTPVQAASQATTQAAHPATQAAAQATTQAPIQTASNTESVRSATTTSTTQSKSTAQSNAITKSTSVKTNTHPISTHPKTANNTQNTVKQPSATNATLALSPAPIPLAKGGAKPKIPHYIVQAGIFQGLTEADALKARLTLQGFAPQIQKVQTQDGHAWFRVTLGPFPSEPLALNQKKRLEDQKVRGILILQRPTE